MQESKLVAEIMSNQIKSVTEDTTVIDAVKMMASFDIGSVVILDGKEQPVGIFSERDLLKRVVGLEKNLTIPIKEVMTSKMVCINENDSIEAAVSVFMDSTFRHLPVVNNKQRVTGMVSLRDILDYVYK